MRMWKLNDTHILMQTHTHTTACKLTRVAFRRCSIFTRFSRTDISVADLLLSRQVVLHSFAVGCFFFSRRGDPFSLPQRAEHQPDIRIGIGTRCVLCSLRLTYSTTKLSAYGQFICCAGAATTAAATRKSNTSACVSALRYLCCSVSQCG